MSRSTKRIRLAPGVVIEIRLPDRKTVLRWITGAAALASIVDLFVNLFSDR